MEKITKAELRERFETHYNHEYATEEEFEKAVEHEYSIDYDQSPPVFTGGDLPFQVVDLE